MLNLKGVTARPDQAQVIHRHTLIAGISMS
jgi:hypothetical protein